MDVPASAFLSVPCVLGASRRLVEAGADRPVEDSQRMHPRGSEARAEGPHGAAAERREHKEHADDSAGGMAG